MRTEDLRALSHIGKALWANPNQATAYPLETFSAVNLITPDEERVIERTSQALLERATRDGSNATAQGVQNPFYRLSAEERFILSALHVGKWTYGRIAKILGKTSEQISELAWSSRVHLSVARQSLPGGMPAPHPTGSKLESVECPEYHPARPWTQSYLDSNLASTEKMFIQEHVQTCASCSQALSRARVVLLTAQSLIPRAYDLDELDKGYHRVIRRSKAITAPDEVSFLESLGIFFSRPEVQIRIFILGAGLVIAFWWKIL